MAAIQNVKYLICGPLYRWLLPFLMVTIVNTNVTLL